MSTAVTNPLTAIRIRGRRTNFIPAPIDTDSSEIVSDSHTHGERVVFVSTIVLAAAALLSAVGFALAILL